MVCEEGGLDHLALDARECGQAVGISVDNYTFVIRTCHLICSNWFERVCEETGLERRSKLHRSLDSCGQKCRACRLRIDARKVKGVVVRQTLSSSTAVVSRYETQRQSTRRGCGRP